MPWGEPIVKHMPCFAATLAEWCCLICSCLMGMGWNYLWRWHGGMASRFGGISRGKLSTSFNPDVRHAVCRFTHHSIGKMGYPSHSHGPWPMGIAQCRITARTISMASQFHRNPIVMAWPPDSGHQPRPIPTRHFPWDKPCRLRWFSRFSPAPDPGLLTNPGLSKTTLDNFKFRWGLPSKQLRLGNGNMQQFLRMGYLPPIAISIGKMIIDQWDNMGYRMPYDDGSNTIQDEGPPTLDDFLHSLRRRTRSCQFQGSTC